MAVVVVDPIESIRGEAMRRIVTANIFPLTSIQRENMEAPTALPYCRITVPQGAEFKFDSQTRQSKTVIIEFDIMTQALSGTQLAGQYAQKIEEEFGINTRSSSSRSITMTGWTGAIAKVTKFGRGTASVESDKNLYYLPVLVYVELSLDLNATYEA